MQQNKHKVMIGKSTFNTVMLLAFYKSKDRTKSYPVGWNANIEQIHEDTHTHKRLCYPDVCYFPYYVLLTVHQPLTENVNSDTLRQMLGTIVFFP